MWEAVNSKRQSPRAYILMESLISLAVLAAIVGLVLNQVNQNRQTMASSLRYQEVLNVAVMAVQSGQSQLDINSISVTVKRTPISLSVYESGREVMYVEKN
ncbi:competence type IV pilus minor pilin ComGE [Streptococcus dentiloxodontae]